MPDTNTANATLPDSTLPDSNLPDSKLIRAFPPVANRQARILILGSMPGVASLQDQQYYAHPRNSFWKIILEIYNSEPLDYNGRCRLLTSNGIAVWDVLKTCKRKGSLDANIQTDSIETNDFEHFFNKHPDITNILLNGKTAETLFRRHVLSKMLTQTKYQIFPLPSTSPAMAALNFEQKKSRWASALVAENSSLKTR